MSDRVEYSPEETKAIIDHVHLLFDTGHPGEALKLKKRFLAGDEIHPSEYQKDVFPERPIEDPELVKPPPRTGPGSGREKWVAWALLAMDVDEEIFESLSRDDIVALAEERGVIPTRE
jgi:hypothetical protein